MRDEPVLVLAGPRTVGKSTLLRELASRWDRDVIDLDDLTTRRVVADNLALYAAGRRPVLIDEFQVLPELLDAIKAELNRDTTPGGFVLTGSTRYSTLPRAAQSLTGRVHVLTVWPLSQGEIDGVREDFVDRLLADPESLVGPALSTTSRDEYADRALTGGLPAALRRSSAAARTRWFADYVQLVIERDVLDIRKIKQREALPVFFRRLAAQTGQLLNIARAGAEAGLGAGTAEDYAQLLEAVFLVHRLPAWGTTLASRVNRLPKVHLVDTGLGGSVLGITPRGIERRIPAAMTEFGHLVETFVVNEILKQAEWAEAPLRFGHFRTSDDLEVDLVVETAENEVFAVEVKAGSTYRREDLRGLAHLRDRVGDRFVAGVLAYSGERAARVDDRIYLVPIDSLWQERQRNTV
jgi:hypothetical protein